MLTPGKVKTSKNRASGPMVDHMFREADTATDVQPIVLHSIESCILQCNCMTNFLRNGWEFEKVECTLYQMSISLGISKVRLRTLSFFLLNGRNTV